MIKPILRELPDRWVTDRLILRPYLESDSAALFESIDESRLSLGEWMPWEPATKTTDDTLAFIRYAIAHWYLRNEINIGMFEKESGRHLGGIGYPRLNWERGHFEIGYWLRSSAVGQGFVTEGTQCLIDSCFRDLEATRVIIQCAAPNRRSASVAERCGLTLEGCLRLATQHYGHGPCDLLSYSILRSEWERR